MPETFPAAGMTVSQGGTSHTVTKVSTVSGTRVVESAIHSTDPSVPDLAQKRTYLYQSGAYVLSEIRTDIASLAGDLQVTGTTVMRLDNVVWNRNASKDAPRRTATGPSPWSESGSLGGGGAYGAESQRGRGRADDRDVGIQKEPGPYCEDPYPGSEPEPGCIDPPGGGGPSVPNPCELTSGGAEIDYVHGIVSSGAAWGNPQFGAGSSGGVRGPLRCDLRIGDDQAPSLTTGGDKGTGAHHLQEGSSRASSRATARAPPS